MPSDIYRCSRFSKTFAATPQPEVVLYEFQREIRIDILYVQKTEVNGLAAPVGLKIQSDLREVMVAR